jgi:hypothetical protein
MRATAAALALLGALSVPAPAAAATCADHPNQASAQQAKDTRDGDGDGIYCEALPCPCLKPGQPSGASPKPKPKPKPKRSTANCTKTPSVQAIGFSSTKYPNIKHHVERAIRAGWPRTLVLNRPGADARRDRLLQEWPTKSGYDRDEYPPAVGRGKGKGLTGGASPRGWIASVMYVPSSENRSHGSRMGIKLRRFCDGQRFRYSFY